MDKARGGRRGPMQPTRLERVGQIEQPLLGVHKGKFALPQLRQSTPGRLPILHPLPKSLDVGVVWKKACAHALSPGLNECQDTTRHCSKTCLFSKKAVT